MNIECWYLEGFIVMNLRIICPTDEGVIINNKIKVFSHFTLIMSEFHVRFDSPLTG